MSDRLCVVMPVYNEEDAVGAVLEKWDAVLKALGADYVIRPYNDGSRDGSLEVMRRVAARLGPQIDVRDKPNGGHGNTILTGYRDAAADGFDWVFQIDSDDEMGPEKFGELWSRRGEYDFLVGIRDGRRQALPRKVMSLVSRLCVRLFYGKGVWDVNTPYRLMRVSAFREFFLQVPLTTFAPNVILSGLAARHRLRLFETRVPQRDRATGEVSIRKWKLAKAAAKSFWQTVWFAVVHVKAASWACLAVVLACLSICLLKSPLLFLPYPDEQVYNMAGKIISRGGLMYRDFFDHKGPAFCLLNGIGWMICKDYMGPWLVFSLVHIVSMCALFWGLVRFGGAWRACLSCICVTMVPRLMDYPESLVFDMSAVAIGALCFWGLSAKAMVVAGIAAAVSFLSKQTCIGCFVGIGAWLALNAVGNARGRRSTMCLAAYLASGAAAVALAVAAICLFWDAPSWWNCTFRFNSLFAGKFGTKSLHRILLLMQGTELYWVLALIGIAAYAGRRTTLSGKVAIAWATAVVWELALALFQAPYGYHWTPLMFLLLLPVTISVASGRLRRNTCAVLLACSIFAFLPILTRSFTNIVHLAKYGNLLTPGGAEPRIPKAVEFVSKFHDAGMVVYGHNLELYIATELKSPLAPNYYFAPFMVKGFLGDSEFDACTARLMDEKRLLIPVVDSEEDLLRPPDVENGRFKDMRSMLAARIAMGDMVRIDPDVSGIPIWITKALMSESK